MKLDCRPAVTPTASYILAPVDGPSLIHKHIVEGDYLLIKITTQYREGRLGLWQTPHGRTAKYADMDGEYLRLHNDKEWEMRWAASEIKLLGVVVKVERDDP